MEKKQSKFWTKFHAYLIRIVAMFSLFSLYVAGAAIPASQVPARVTMTARTVFVPLHEAGGISASVETAAGLVLENDTVTWTTSNANVVLKSYAKNAVNATGMNGGTATVTAHYGKLSASVVVMVLVPTYLEISASSVIVLGTTHTFNITVLDQRRQPWVDGRLLANPLLAGGTLVSVNNSDGTLLAFKAGVGSLTASVFYEQADGGKSVTATMPITVTAAGSAYYITPASASVIVGESQPLRLMNPLPAAYCAAPLFSVSNTAIASVSPNGAADALVTTHKVGTITVSGECQGIVATTTLSVLPLPPPVLHSIVITPSTAALIVGQSQKFSAQGYDQYGALFAAQFSWSANSNAIVSNGTATATAAGTALVTASAAGIVSAPATMSIQPQIPSSLTLVLGNLLVGGNEQATVNVFDQLGRPMLTPIAWTASNGDVSISNGLVQGVSAGSVTVTATAGAVSTSASIAVSDYLKSIVVTPNIVSIPARTSLQFTATGYSETGNVFPINPVWSSTGLVTVSNAGLVYGTDNGVGTVVASANGVVGTAQVSVTSAVTTITVTSPVPSIYTGSYGSTAQLSAVAKDQDGNVMQVPFTWSSDNQAVASVNSAGLVTGLTPGTANIQAASGSVSGQFNIAVVQEPSFLSTVIVSPGSGSTHVDGSTVQFTAVALDEYNNVLASVPFTWTSTAPATVDNTGLATGVSAGVATIQASATLFSPELNRNFTVTSNPATLAVGSVPMLSSITLAPATVSLAVVEPIGDLPSNTLLTPTSLDQYGNLISETYTWTSDAPAVASVDGSGNVTGLTVGTAHIWASSEGVNSTQTTVSVTNAPSVPTYLTVSPTAMTQYVGVVSTLIASPEDQFQNPIQETLSWSTSDSTVATADANGNVTAVAPGTATITVETGTLFAQSSVTVAAEPTISGMYEFNVAGGPLIEASLVQVGTVIEAYKAPNGCLTAVTLAPKSVSQICNWVTQTVGSSSANVVNLYILGLPSKGSFDANGNLSGPGWTATQVQPISGLWTGSISLKNGACTATSVNFAQANNSQVALTGCGTFTFNQIANYTTWTQGNDLELSYTNGASLQFTNLTFSLFGDNGILTQQ